MQFGMLGWGGACLEWVFSCSDGWQISTMFSRHIIGGREKVENLCISFNQQILSESAQ
jgi:hypothetical protein